METTSPPLSEFERGVFVGLMVGEASFGGDGKQPQITLRMHVRHEALFHWLMARFPATRLYGPYHHGGRSYFQWMARGRALVRDRRLAAWGVIRPCRRGWKVGPLIADDRASAEAVLSTLIADIGGDEIFLDVPSVNHAAVALAQGLGLAPVFETARMYTGRVPPLRLERVFGVTTFELG